MQDLSTLAKGIKIGNAAASIMANMAAGLNFGRGLFHDTTFMGVRAANMSNNYNYYSSYRNIKSKIQSSNSKRFFFDRLLDAPNIDGLEIGWGYTTDINKHSLNVGFASSSDFDSFQKLLRERNLYHGRHGKEYKEIYSDFDKNFNSKEIYRGGSSERGDKIVLDSSYKEPSKISTIIENYHLVNLIDILVESQNKWKEAPYWDFSKPYSLDNAKLEVYSVDEKYQRKDDIIISAKEKGGTLHVHNILNNEDINYYYQENENGTYVLKSDGKSSSDGNLPYIPTSFDNASKLLRKTNELFRSGKIKTLINRFHTENLNTDELTTAISEGYGMSRGRNLLRKNPKNGNYDDSSYDNPYCRTWTAHHQYAKLKDRIRPFLTEDGKFKSIEETQKSLGELRPNNGSKRLNNLSVLQENGFVKISPTHNHIEKNDLKKYMFSIENLAWKDNKSELSKEQQGPNGGRIMWFPPYNLRFSENINVNWNPNNFIGRGEQIYTYTNTERSGTLDFTILIDHPSSINKWRGTTANIDNKFEKEQDILRYFAGCGELDEGVVPEKKIINKSELGETFNINKKPKTSIKDIAYIIFFPNNFSADDYIKNINSGIDILQKYEYKADDTTEIDNRDSSFSKEILQPHNIKNTNSGKGINNFKGNSEVIKLIRDEVFNGDENIEIRSFDELLKLNNEYTGTMLFGLDAKTCKVSSIDLQGFATSHGYEVNNIKLCDRRRNFIETIIETKCNWIDINKISYNYLDGSIKKMPNDGGRNDVNTLSAKLGRAAIAIFHVDWINEVNASNTPSEGSEVISSGVDITIPEQKNENKDIISNLKETLEIEKPKQDMYSYDNEYLYFSEINESEHNFIYRNIVDKVRFFDPAFHSITPEGFNSRLTFLHQCTRQGPTSSVSGGKVNADSNDYLKYAGNLAFGRAPYCILRIGDFFYTKICIDSISIQYDNNGVQWDLNPEGAGVQPMYATVSLNFKFLGGQDIGGPIERLQNAITSNYYANASIYDKRAEYKE